LHPITLLLLYNSHYTLPLKGNHNTPNHVIKVKNAEVWRCFY
jgi:hypothetical protein